MADKKNAKAEDQHYVPKHILRNFTRGHKEKVCVFEKDTGKTFETNLRNILAERRFNDVFFGDKVISFEPIITELEDTLLGPFRRVIAARNLADLTPEERHHLPVLLAFQHLRTKQFRENISGMRGHFLHFLEEIGADVEGFGKLFPARPEETKKFSFSFLGSHLTDIAESVATKKLVLMGTTSEKPFYLGDNPVVLHNSTPGRFFGNLGFEVEGIEIYMPLSNTLTLAAYCPTLIERVRNNLVRATMTGSLGSHQGKRAMSLLSAVDKGTLHTIEPAGVDFLNSLQVAYAGRFVICPKGDFTVAKEVARQQAADRPTSRHRQTIMASNYPQTPH